MQPESTGSIYEVTDLDKEPIIVGEIINTHSNRGAVKVKPLTDFPERFFDRESVLLADGDRLLVLHITSVREHKGNILLTFREIPDMNAAEKLKGKYLKIRQEELKELPPDNYYLFQIIGLKAVDTDGCYLGQITDVLATGSNDVYVIQPPDSEGQRSAPILLPALKKNVLQVDLAAKQMTVRIPEGLLD